MLKPLKSVLSHFDTKVKVWNIDILTESLCLNIDTQHAPDTWQVRTGISKIIKIGLKKKTHKNSNSRISAKGRESLLQHLGSSVS